MSRVERSGNRAGAGKIAQYRRRVPSDLRDIIGQTEIKKTLRTTDAAAARVAWRRMDLEVEQRFAAARQQMPVDIPIRVRRNAPKVTLGAADRAYILARAQHRLLDRDDDFRAATHPDDERQWSLYGDQIEAQLELAESFRRGIHPTIRVQLDSDLHTAGVALDPVSTDYTSLASDYNRTVMETLEQICERARGRRIVLTPPEPQQSGKASPSGTRGPSLSGAPTLHTVLKQWKAEHQPTDQSAAEALLAVNEFVTCTGVAVLKDIRKAHVVTYKDFCRQLPGKRKGTLAATATVKKRLSVIKTLLAYAERNDLLETNVAQSVTVGVSKVRKGPRRAPFEKPHFATIFTSRIYTAGYRPIGGGGEAAYWLPLVGTMTGMRLDEIGSRFVADVKERDGIHFLEVHNSSEGQSVKTDGSWREIPIHSELIRLGFLDYVNHVRGQRQSELFPDLRRSATKVQKGKATKAFSQWWGRWLRNELKLTDRTLVFHSFRHAFKRFARDADINPEIHDLLTGHSPGNVGSTYGKGAGIKTLKAGIEKIDFADLMPPMSSWIAPPSRVRVKSGAESQRSDEAMPA